MADELGAEAVAFRAIQVLNGRGLPGLFMQIRAGNSEPFFSALRGAPNLIHARDGEGNTPLHWFALRGEMENVQRAIDAGAEVSNGRPRVGTA
jgi:ankyrin repeat protein